jgi:hypothetical protein
LLYFSSGYNKTRHEREKRKPGKHSVSVIHRLSQAEERLSMLQQNLQPRRADLGRMRDETFAEAETHHGKPQQRRK